MSNLRIIALALLALLPAAAEAQFTTFTPPRPRVDTTRTVVTRADSIGAADSVARATITNLKAWVDSAAGDIVVNRVDTAGRPTAATGPVTAGRTEPTSVFRDGARAPDTATWLPLIALVGVGAVGVGVLLLRGRSSA